MGSSVSAILRDSEEAYWSLDEVTTGLIDLDFSRPFMPEALVHANGISFLDDSERLVLNQIRGHAYLGISAIGERFVLPFILSQASRTHHRDEEEFLALMGASHRAAKHIVAFARLGSACERGFETELGLLGPAAEAIAPLLTRDTLAVGLLALHVETAAQAHSLRAMRCTEPINEPFRRFLQLHWREESQTARLFELVLGELTNEASRHERERAFEQYLAMLDVLAVSLHEQVRLDLTAFEWTLRRLSDEEQAEWIDVQRRSYEDVFLGCGVEHPAVRRTVANLLGEPSTALLGAAERFSFTPRHARA